MISEDSEAVGSSGRTLTVSGPRVAAFDEGVVSWKKHLIWGRTQYSLGCPGTLAIVCDSKGFTEGLNVLW